MQSAHATHPVARDSKITTFPGLYVAGVAFARAVGLVTGAGADAPAAAVCNPSVLRSINLCFGLGTLVLLFCLLRRRMPAGKAGAGIHPGITAAAVGRVAGASGDIPGCLQAGTPP